MPSKTTFKRVTFQNKIGINLVGNVHYPSGFDSSKKYPAIVTIGPAGASKEQAAGLYAKKLAEQGFVTIAFDSSYQGESGGLPRFREDPNARVEDVRGAVDYLTTLPYIDENRIGALGICAGGGYVITAAMTERRIKAVATAVPVNGGKENRAGGQQASIEMLESIAKQRTAEARGAEPMLVEWMPDEYKNSEDIDLHEGYDYYRTSRNPFPKWNQKMLFTSLDAVMVYDSFYLADMLLTQPLQIVVGNRDGSFHSGQTGHELYQVAASKQKDILVLEGASHFDLYDKPQYVAQAVNKFSSFFNANLK